METTTIDKSKIVNFKPTNTQINTEGWKHSYLDKINATLDKQQAFIDMLKKRISLKPMFESEYDKNERAILCYDTQNRIIALERENKERRNYFVKFVEDFEKKIAECNEHFSKVEGFAIEKKSKNPFIEIAFEQYANPTNDAEKKVSHYFRLKQLTGYKI